MHVLVLVLGPERDSAPAVDAVLVWAACTDRWLRTKALDRYDASG